MIARLSRPSRLSFLTALVLAAVVSTTMAASAHAETLGGTIAITPGLETGGVPSGSYFRMQYPAEFGGGYYENEDSGNTSDPTYTLLEQGETGLELNTNQEPASPAFDGSCNSLSDAILAPTPFSDGPGVFYNFSIATPSTDVTVTPNVSNPPITLSTTGSGPIYDLTGNLTAWTAYWGCQVFDQGSTSLTGSTWNEGNKKVTLNWTSTVVGGPFNGFTGHWHIEGVLS